MSSIFHILVVSLMALALLALAIKLLSRKVVVALGLIALLWVIHPKLRCEILATLSFLVAGIMPLALILLGLWIMVFGWTKGKGSKGR